MAVVHIKSTGTKTSGKSTADDWSDANCYPIASWVTALGASEAGDEMIFDDEAFVAANLSLNAITTSVTIKSRSGGGSLKLSDGTTAWCTYNSASGAAITFEDIALDGEGVTWTSNGAPLMLITQNCSAITFRRVTWRNITCTSSANRTVPLLLRYLPSLSGAAGAVVVEDCAISDVDVDCTGDCSGLFTIQNNGANSVDNSMTVSGLDLTNVSIICTGGSNLGVIRHTNESVCAMSDISLSTCHFEASTGETNAGFYRPSGTVGTFSVDGLTIEGVTMHGLASTEGIIKGIQTGTIKNVTCSELRRTGTESGGGNSIGGVVVAQSSSGDVSVEDMVVHDSGGFFGTAFYNSGGAALTAKRVLAYDIDDGGQVGTPGIPVNGIAFYSGGHGNSTWESCIAMRVTGAAENGIAWYIHHTDTSGTANKTAIMRNCSFTGTVSSAEQPAGRIIGASAANTTTVTIQNTLFDNGVNEFELSQSDAGAITVTGTTCHITEGEEAATAASGTLDMSSGLTEGDAKVKLINDDRMYELHNSSPASAAGTWLAGVRGYDDNALPQPPDIGAVQNRNLPGRAQGAG